MNLLKEDLICDKPNNKVLNLKENLNKTGY